MVESVLPRQGAQVQFLVRDQNLSAVGYDQKEKKKKTGLENGGKGTH